MKASATFGLYPNKRINGKMYMVYGIFLEDEIKAANRLVRQVPGAIRRKEGGHQIVYIPIIKHSVRQRKNLKEDVLSKLHKPLIGFKLE